MFHEKISRRDFLKKVGKTAVGVGMVAAKTYTEFQSVRPLARVLFDFAQSVPCTDENGDQISYPSAGWLETPVASRGPFLTAQEGAFPYLRNMLLGSPVLKASMRNLNRQTIENGQPSEPPRLGDLFIKHVESAGQALSQTYKNTSPSLDDSVHVAVFTMAAFLDPYIRPFEWALLGLSLPETEGREWSQIFSPYVPHIFPVTESLDISDEDYQDRYAGTDRAVHAVQHLFVAYEYLYASQNGLPESRQIPIALSSVLDLYKGTPDKKADLLSAITGMAWETIETKVYLDTLLSADKDKRGEIVPSGWTDEFVRRDLTANTWGSNLGIRLSTPYLSVDGLSRIIADMNDEKRYKEG